MYLSEESLVVMRFLMTQFVKARYPNHHAWAFSPATQEQRLVFNELAAHDLITPFTNVMWRLTDVGLGWILENREHSNDDAEDELNEIGVEYIKAGLPPRQTWAFSELRNAGELQAMGYIEPFAIGSFILTEHGKHTLLERRS